MRINIMLIELILVTLCCFFPANVFSMTVDKLCSNFQSAADEINKMLPMPNDITSNWVSQNVILNDGVCLILNTHEIDSTKYAIFLSQMNDLSVSKNIDIMRLLINNGTFGSEMKKNVEVSVRRAYKKIIHHKMFKVINTYRFKNPFLESFKVTIDNTY